MPREFLKSEARASTAGDWIASRRGGPDVAAVFETTNGQPLDAVRIPEFFTYSGFHQKFIARLPGLAERMKNGTLGAGRCRPADGGGAAV